MAKQSIQRPKLAAAGKKDRSGKKKSITVKKIRVEKKKRNIGKLKMATGKKSSSRLAPQGKKVQKRQPAAKKDRFQERLSGYSGEKGALIPLLQAAQETYGYIPLSAIDQIHEVVGIPKAEIYGVITFYSQFRLKPLGKYLIKLCDGTACHVNGSERIASAIEDILQLGGSDTTADGLFTMQKVACLGCCSLSPVIMINDETFGRLTPKKVQQLLKEYKSKTLNAQTA